MEYTEVPLSPAKEPALLADLRIGVSPRRWAVLGMFLLFCMATAFQWVQYTIVGDLVARYYGVSASQIDWTSLIYMVALVVLILPVSFFLDKKGMGWTMKSGALLLAAGSWIKVVGAAPGRFSLALLGQGLVATSQVFEMGAPTRIAALWFGPEELSTACAIGIIGNELGQAIGFLLSPLMVRHHDDPEDIGKDLQFMLLTTAGVSTFVFLLVMLLFKDRPELPPSRGQALERCSAAPVTLKQFLRSLGELLSNRNYLLVMAASGINGGALNAICTVLSPVILHHFPDGQEFAGRVGLMMMLCGLLGEFMMGVILDKTHKFKEISVGVFILQALANAVFAFVLRAENATLVYISAGLFGLFLFAYVTSSFEIAAEVTYPVSESTMGGLLLIPANILGCIVTVSFTWAMKHWGDFTANMLLSASLMLGAVLCTFVSKDYRRLAANTGPVKA